MSKSAKQIEKLLELARIRRGPIDKKADNERWRKQIGAQAWKRPEPGVPLSRGPRGSLGTQSELQKAHPDASLVEAIREKSKFVGIAYNKGGLQLLSTRQDALDAGKK